MVRIRFARKTPTSIPGSGDTMQPPPTPLFANNTARAAAWEAARSASPSPGPRPRNRTSVSPSPASVGVGGGGAEHDKPLAAPAPAAPQMSTTRKRAGRGRQAEASGNVRDDNSNNGGSSPSATASAAGGVGVGGVGVGVTGRAPRAKKESLKKRESSNFKIGGGGGGGGSSSTSHSHSKDHHHDGVGGGEKDTRKANTPESSSLSTSTSKSKKQQHHQGEKRKRDDVQPQRFKLPPPKLSDFEVPKGPVFTEAHTKVVGRGNGNGNGAGEVEVQFCETSDHVLNKKLFHYTQCIADPAFPRSNYYRKTDTVPFGPAISLEDTSTEMFLDETAHHITTEKGFRMGKANTCVRFGRWYWECKITSGIPRRKGGEPRGHVRMGWARREATLDAPVGFDAYSYALRDVGGQKVFMSRPKDFFPPGEDIKEGDVIGLEINLPSETLHRKIVEGHYNPAVDLVDDEKPSLEAADVVRDRVPIRFKTHTYFEQVDYHTSKELEELMNPSPVIATTGGITGSGGEEQPHATHPLPALRTLPHSSIVVYKNGKLMGTPFTDLLAFLPPASRPLVDKSQVQIGAREGLDDGMLGYYPAVSVFRGGAAEVNFGPEFWFPPPGLRREETGKNSREENEEEEEDEVDMIGGDSTSISKSQQKQQQQQPIHSTSDTTTGNNKENKEIRPVADRFEEQIVEDILFDIIDEVDFWITDGMPDGAVVGGGGNNASSLRGGGIGGVGGAGVAGGSALGGGGEGLGVVGGSIKELVQDE